MEGHPAAECTNPIACALCKQQERSFDHRVGSAQCGADFSGKGRKNQVQGVPTPMEVDVPARRAVDNETSDDE